MGTVDENRPRGETFSDASPVFTRLLWTYLVVVLLAAAGDNLQGSFRYALLESYGISRSTIELLQVSSYGSSLVIGTFTAALADRYGRRRACFLCVFLYSLYCILLNVPVLWILAVGTVFWGVANAFYQTSFDAWMIQEHRDRSLDEASLKLILRDAHVGTALVSVGAGFLAQFAVNLLGLVAPFDTAILFFLFTALALGLLWPENYGVKAAKPTASIVSAAQVLRADPRIVLLGLSLAFFDASLYIFVIEWTPTLQQAANTHLKKPLPLGFIFSLFMSFDTLGSFLFYPLAKRARAQSFLIVVFVIASISLAMPMIAPQSFSAILGGFLVFELCAGIVKPSGSLLKSQYISNEVRATMMSFIRVPQIAFMLIILLSHFSLSVVFIICACFNVAALICMIVLRSLKMPEERAHIGEADFLLENPPSPSPSPLPPQTSTNSDEP